MSNQLYTSMKEDFLAGGINLSSASIRVALVKAGYTVDIDNDRYVSDIGTANIAGRSGNLDKVSITDGIFDAENETIEDYGTEGFSYMVMYEHTGNDATSRLIAYLDTGIGLPVASTTESISVTIKWSDLLTKIFSL